MPRASVLAVVAGVLGLAVGLVVGVQWLAPGPAAETPARTAMSGISAPAADGSLAAELDALRAALLEERDAREALAADVARLESVLAGDAIASAPPAAAADAPGPEPSKPAADAGARPAPAAEALAALRRAAERTGRPWFDRDALASRGLPPERAERIESRFEQHEMERLYLRDEATREGWLRTRRFRDEGQALEAELRNDLGETDYDWLLFATGQPNRVVLADVLKSSPAADAGLQQGDVVVRYDDAVVRQPRELQQATYVRRPGVIVPVDVLRDGEIRRFYLPIGPLGARLKGESRAPEAR